MPYVKSEWTDDFDKYREVVSEHLKRFYYITWDDACGDEEPIRRAIECKETPTDFAEWWALKYDLLSIFDDSISEILKYSRSLKVGKRDSDDQDRSGI